MRQRFAPYCIVRSENGRVGTLWTLDNGFIFRPPERPVQSSYNPHREVIELRRKLRKLEAQLQDASVLNAGLMEKTRRLKRKLSLAAE